MTNETARANLKPDPSLSVSERMQHPLFATGGKLMPDRLYTACEVAIILNVAMSTLRRWRSDGKGPHVTRLVKGGRPVYRGLHVVQALEEAAEV